MIDRFSWMAIYPELVLMVMACVIALLDLLDKRLGRPVAYILSVLTLLVLAVLSGLYASSGQTVYGFDGLVVSDPMANWLKCSTDWPPQACGCRSPTTFMTACC